MSMIYRKAFIQVFFFFTFYHALMAQSVEAAKSIERDTTEAKKLYEAGISLIKNTDYATALSKLDSGEMLLKRSGFEVSALMGNILHQKGRANSFSLHYKESVQCYKKSLDIRIKVFGEFHPDVAQSYNNLAIRYQKEGNLDTALLFAKRALDIRMNVLGESHPLVAMSDMLIGDCLAQRADYKKAVEYYEKAVYIKENSAKGADLDLALIYNNYANILGDIGEFDRALSLHRSALAIRTRQLGEQNIETARSLLNIGKTLLQMDKLDEVYSYLEKSYEIKVSILGKDHPDIIWCRNLFGSYYNAIGQYDDAISEYLEGIKLSIRYYGEGSDETVRLYIGIGNSYSNKSQYELALLYYNRALDESIQKFGEGNVNVSVCLTDIGAIYFRLDKYNKAAECFQQALNNDKKNFKEDAPNLIEEYRNYAATVLQMGKFDEAISSYSKGLDICVKTFGEDSYDAAIFYDQIGGCYSFQKNYEKALEYHNKALNIFLQKSNKFTHSDLGICYSNIALNYEKEQNKTLAIQNYQSAISAFLSGGEQNYALIDFSLFGTVLKRYGYFLLDCYKETNNSSYLESAYSIFTKIPDILASKQFKVSVDQDRMNLNQSEFYEGAIVSAMELSKIKTSDNYKKKAYEYSELAKSTVLNFAYREARAKQFAGIPDSLLALERNLRLALAFYEKRRQLYFDKDHSDTDTAFLALTSKIFDLHSEDERLKQRFEMDYPEYYKLKYDHSTTSLSYVQDTLLNAGQCLLEYFNGDSSVYILVVRPDTFLIAEVKKDFPLEDLVRQLRMGLCSYYERGAVGAVYYDSTALEYAHAAFQIYHRLVAPIADLLAEKVILVPDGVLGYIPFDVLLTKMPAFPTRFYSHAYFGREHQISYAYSATLLRDMREKQHKVYPKESLLAMAPFFQGDGQALREQIDTSFSFAVGRGDTLLPLRYSGREALTAEKIFHGKALLGVDANIHAFQNLAGQYKILHLSTHGKANDRNGEYGYLGFALPDGTIDRLYAKDIYNFSLNADLVVLSACETGIGQLHRGEGIISMARAFAYAGAKSMVTSLWQVDDERTSLLMQYFYNNLQKGMPKDEALWQAKRDFLKENKSNAHPFFWAGFIPIGDMEMVKH